MLQFVLKKNNYDLFFNGQSNVISLSGLDSIMIKVFVSKSVDREPRKITLNRKNIGEVCAYSIEMR